jgi:pyruvate/oxaloacetate carboxyltransferase
MQSSDEGDTDDVYLSVTRSKERIILTLKAPQKEDGFMNIDIPGIAENFKNIAMYYRVFSESLARPVDKRIKQIPGGQERVFGLKDMLKKGHHAHLEASFAIKNTGHN